MTLTRPFLGLTLALLVALTSQHAALARGQSAATGELVICTGTGLITVHLDAEGNPTVPAHFCPDCTKALATALIPAQAGWRPAAAWTAAAPLPEPAVVAVTATERPLARGPPRPV